MAKRARDLVSRRDFLKSGAAFAGTALLPIGFSLGSMAARRTWADSSSSSAGFDYYIGLNGSDTNAGTSPTAPWAITSLLDTNKNNAKLAGKSVGLIAGTYNLANMASGSQASDYQYPILHLPAGTAASPTSIASCDSSGVYARGAAILNMAGNTGVNSVIGQDGGGAGYFTLDGLTITGGDVSNAGASGSGFNGSLLSFFPNSGNGIIVQNCEIYGLLGTIVGNNVAGIFNQGATGTIIKNNYFHDLYKPDQADHCHGYEEYDCVGTQIIYNTFVSVSEAIDGKVGDSGANVAYNYFYNMTNQLAIRGYDGAEGNPNTPNTPNIANVIHHNIFDSAGGQRGCDVNDITSQAITWYNNTSYDTRTGSITTLDLRASTSGLIQCYNNINVCPASSGGQYTGNIAQSSGGYTVLDYNDYSFNNYSSGWGLKGSSAYTLSSSLSAWQSASGTEAHSMTSDPKFVSTITPGAGPAQFNLASGSPCIGAGREGGLSTGAAVNMGAWDGTVSQIGCSFAPGASGVLVPDAPTLLKVSG